MAGKELAKAGMDAGRKSVMKEVMNAGKQVMMDLKDEMLGVAIKQTAKTAVQEAVQQTMKQIFKPLFQLAARQALSVGVGNAGLSIAKGVNNLAIADIRADAAEAQKEADLAAAAAKALDATIQMLRKMIEQLQDQLGDMIESSMESVSAIFNAADESQETMKTLFQTQAA